ncbi:MAG TPA: thioredoxin family protein [Pseudogracilibacillus sp.]|nr:thioredoxin family protein [Pseudogracilibacillus sp.]
MLIQANQETLKKDDYLLYIYTPFCGTCHYAKKILEDIENTFSKEVFYEINASFYPSFMQEEKVESVPCLVIKQEGEVKKKIYTFHSVPFMVREVMAYPNLII